MFLAPTMWKVTRPPVTGAHTDHYALGTAGTTYGTTRTATGQALGTAAANRTIIACVTGIEEPTGVASVTIAGVTATNYYEGSTTDCNLSFWAANVPTGTTGSITITFDNSVSACGCSLYAVYGLSSLTPVHTASSTADPATTSSMSINNGVGIGLACPGHAAAIIPSWSGFTLDTDFNIYDGERGMTTASVFTSGSATPSCNWTYFGPGLALFAVWR